MNQSSINSMLSVLSTCVIFAASGCAMESAPEDEFENVEESIEALSADASDRATYCFNLLDGDAEIKSVLSVQVVSDTHLFEGGGNEMIKAYAPNGDTNWSRPLTCIGVFDALLTSDPASGGSRQIGAIGRVPTFSSPTESEVVINTSALTAGSYWIRYLTPMADGSVEAAEGALLIH